SSRDAGFFFGFLVSWNGLRFDPFGEVGVHLLGPVAVYLAGRVLAFADTHLSPLVLFANTLRLFDDFLRQMRRDEDDAGTGAKHHVAGQAGRLADTDRA